MTAPDRDALRRGFDVHRRDLTEWLATAQRRMDELTRTLTAENLAEPDGNGAAPAAYRAVADRVARGELTWEQVLTGAVTDRTTERFGALLAERLGAVGELVATAIEIVDAEGAEPGEAIERAQAELDERARRKRLGKPEE